MTMQNLASFGAALNSDQALRSELEQKVDGKTGQEGVSAVADFATAKGYDVTTQEVSTGLDALRKLQDGKEEELSDNELEVVSGGKGSGHKTGSDIFNGIKNGVNQGAGFLLGITGH